MTRVPVLGALAARPRLLIAAACGIAIGLVEFGLPATTRFLVAWDVFIATHLVLVAIMIAQSNPDDLNERAEREDPGAALILIFFALAALASLGATVLELRAMKATGGSLAALGGLLVGGTILLSWLFAHTTFGLHYAHDYYAGKEDRKGLNFPGETPPDYWDFLYFSFNLGAAAQTSDVQIESPRTRRTVLAHTIVSFLFNTGVLALAINVGASLIGGGS